MDRSLRIAALAASNRTGSLNRRLLERAVSAVEATRGGVEVDVIDLRRYPLPLYDADNQARDGIPVAAHAIHDRIAAADAVLIASPEYNGGYPALFKNTLDWVSRIDMLLLHPRYVGILSTTPGKGGGANGAQHLRSLFDNIFVTTHEPFTLPKGNEAMGEAPAEGEPDVGWADETARERLGQWAGSFVDAAVAKAEDVAAA